MEDFVFKLFVLDMAQWEGGRSNARTSMECRRVRFSTVGGSMEHFLLANRNRPGTLATPSTAAGRDYYRALYDRSKLYFAPCEATKRIRLLYQDEEDDWVVIGSNEELADAMMGVLEQRSRSSLAVGVQIVDNLQPKVIPKLLANGNSERYQAAKISSCSLKGDQSGVGCRFSSAGSNRKWKWALRIYLVMASTMALVCAATLCVTIGTYLSHWHGGVGGQEATEFGHEYPTVVSSGMHSPRKLSDSLNQETDVYTSKVGSASVPLGGTDCDPSVSSCSSDARLRKNLMFSDILARADSSISHPLWKAYSWVRMDPHWHRYPKERLRQRLGLAIFYYATNGDQSWKHSDDWLSYQVHECHWWPGSYSMPLCGSDENRQYQGNAWQYERLWLPDNGLEGHIPAQTFDLLPSLRTIRLDRNIWLSGTLPTEVGGLTQLHQLWLHQNTFSGSLPSELAHLTQLERLSLAENRFTGRLAPETFGNLTSLRKLWLDHNSFTGSVPSQMGGLPLVKLHLSHNQFENGGLPANLLASLTRLEHLVVSISTASSEEQDVVIPTEVGLMSNLRHLDLYLPERTRSSLASHQWQRSEVATLHKLETLRIASETSGEELVDLATL